MMSVFLMLLSFVVILLFLLGLWGVSVFIGKYHLRNESFRIENEKNQLQNTLLLKQLT